MHAENALILKRFAVQFVNHYGALLYTAFWLNDFQKLRRLMVYLMVVAAVSKKEDNQLSLLSGNDSIIH